jgi:hypothetical protein
VGAVPGFCSYMGAVTGCCSCVGTVADCCTCVGAVPGFCSYMGAVTGCYSCVGTMAGCCSPADSSASSTPVRTIGWGCTGPRTDVTGDGVDADTTGCTSCRVGGVGDGCAIGYDASCPCTNSVCVEVEDGIGVPCCVLGEAGHGEGEEAGRVRPCMKVRTLDGEEAPEDIGGEATR